MVFYTPEQIAEILQVKPSLVYSLLKRGQLQAFVLGKIGVSATTNFNHFCSCIR